MAVAGERFRGVRNRTAWHPSPEVRSNLTMPPPGPLAHPGFAEGAKRLAGFGLVLDVWGYAVLWNAFKRLAAGASATEKAALFSGTAVRAYRLDRLPPGIAPDLGA